jgi:integration host factor subunit alpha
MLSKLIKQNTVTKETLAKAIKKKTGIGVSKSSLILDEIINIIVGSVKSNKQVKIRLFGSFYTKRKSERIGRNPKTMEEARIPARTVVKFKVAPTLKKKINSNI